MEVINRINNSNKYFNLRIFRHQFLSSYFIRISVKFKVQKWERKRPRLTIHYANHHDFYNDGLSYMRREKHKNWIRTQKKLL